MTNLLPVEIVEPIDISNAIVWLVSDDARYVTGVTLPSTPASRTRSEARFPALNALPVDAGSVTR